MPSNENPGSPFATTIPTGIIVAYAKGVEDGAESGSGEVVGVITRPPTPGHRGPQLRFVEDNCVQCGLCARACPENAIGPSPRYLFDDQARRRIRVLKEEEPFLCIGCGTPFATRTVILQISARLKGNPNLGPAEFKRLRMREECRGKDLLDKLRAEDRLKTEGLVQQGQP